jgi:thiamine pyrophosphokinase
MRHTLVVGAAPLPGHEPFYRGLLSACTHLVAADAAGEWCVALGRVPDVVVGDFDGSLPGALERLRALGAEVRVHPVGKDATDLELAVVHARTAWRCPVVLTATFTSRVDHTLAAFGALIRAGEGACARDPFWTGYVCADARPVRLDLPTGVVVSVLSLAGDPRVTIDGAVWALRETELPVLSGLGVSNRAIGGPFSVSATNGTLVVMVHERE